MKVSALQRWARCWSLWLQWPLPELTCNESFSQDTCIPCRGTQSPSHMTLYLTRAVPVVSTNSSLSTQLHAGETALFTSLTIHWEAGLETTRVSLCPWTSALYEIIPVLKLPIVHSEHGTQGGIALGGSTKQQHTVTCSEQHTHTLRAECALPGSELSHRCAGTSPAVPGAQMLKTPRGEGAEHGGIELGDSGTPSR